MNKFKMVLDSLQLSERDKIKLYLIYLNSLTQQKIKLVGRGY